jgi:hypothetical protein
MLKRRTFLSLFFSQGEMFMKPKKARTTEPAVAHGASQLIPLIEIEASLKIVR